MNNMFLKRVGRLLEGLPMKGYSEACKPIRDPVRPKETGKRTQSEFALHNQVLQNTWGRIEFEIQPILHGLTEKNDRGGANGENSPARKELDCRVRVKTRYRMAMEEQLKKKPTEECPERFLIPNQESLGVSAKPITDQTNSIQNPGDDLPGATQEAKVVSDKVERKSPTRAKHSMCARVEEIHLDETLSTEKTPSRREFYCRESRRMLTLISERKANAEILKEKSVFVNFSLPVLSTLARSPQTPKSALKWLAFHESAAIRKSVAKNLNTDLDILEILAHDEDESIRMAVAENPVVTKEFLLKLLNDDMSMVVDKAKSILHNMARSEANGNNLATLQALSDFVDGDEASKTNESSNDLDFLQVVAAKETTPVHRLMQLSKHNDWHIRKAVAGNPSTTVRTLSWLAQDHMPAVRNEALANCNCPPEVILHTAVK